MKPGTALPWVLDGAVILTANQRAHGVGLVADCNDNEVSAKRSKRNAEYIAHAANAYPKLVEALAGLFEHCAMIHKHWGEGSNAKQADAAQNAARDLLRELGEAS